MFDEKNHKQIINIFKSINIQSINPDIFSEMPCSKQNYPERIFPVVLCSLLEISALNLRTSLTETKCNSQMMLG